MDDSRFTIFASNKKHPFEEPAQHGLNFLLFYNLSRNSEKPFQCECAYVDIAKFSVLASCLCIMQHIYIVTKQIETCDFKIYTLLASNN
jgi:hypothetical protein